MSDNQTLKQKTLHGIKWSYISTITTAILQIGYTAIMARLLNPSDFGLVAMGGVVLRFGQYFAQMGMGSALIQKKDLTKENVSAAFTSSIFLGLIFTILTILFAPLAKYIFNYVDVVKIIRLMGLSFIINGFSLTSLALIRRSLNFKILAISEISAYLIGYIIIGIGSAFIGFGVWSLVFASLSQTTVLGILTFLTVRHNISLTFSWNHYKPLFSFGSKVSIISFLEFIGGSLDTILIGRILGDKKLGFYNRAQMLISLPMTYLMTSFSKVLFPSLSQIQDDNEKIKRNMFLILKMVSIVIFPFAIVVAILSKEIVYIILGPKWVESVNILRILAIAFAIDYFEHLLATLFEAKGYLGQKIYLQTFYVIILTITFYVFYPLGLEGFALAILFSQLIRFVGYSILFLKNINIVLTDFIKVFNSTLLTSLLTFVGIFTSYILINLFSHNLIINFLINSFLAVVVYLILLFLRINEDVRKNMFNILGLLIRGKNEASISITRS